ncbi:AmmeMemoRadiSam system protein B [Candidatus Woesearchaeota archaeon]|nr:AmmeMemoRadiSam system protein B [Candidatus Woesearchaeota archaeon]
MSIRQAAVAGAFYPSDKNELEKMLLHFLDKAPSSGINPKAIIVPHAGYVYSGQVAAYAYKWVKGKNRAIILGPSHYKYLTNAVSDTNDEWETPLGKAEVATSSEFVRIEEPHVQEHCIEVQVPFIQKVLGKASIMPIVVGDADPIKISAQLERVLDDRTILVISSDLSHFHDYETAIRLDNNSCAAIEMLNYEKFATEGEACGKIPILAVMDLAKRLGWKCRMLYYANSGDVTGDKSKVVGYASFALY